jgi:NADH-quinone oxidoreductase subunit C
MEILELKDKIETLLREKLGDSLLSVSVEKDFPVFEVEKKVLYETLEFLKNNEACGFNFLTTCCGLHYPDNADKEFGMMYQLHNLISNTRIRIKTFMSREDLEIPSIIGLWPAAGWMERQEYDFFGFEFTGHPDLRRILNMDEMNYFPMRKEFPLEDGSRDDKNDTMFGR